MDLYKLIWKPLGKPVTYVMRETVRRYPLAYVYGALVLGWLMGWLGGVWVGVLVLGVLGAGIVVGHAWWDTRGAHIPRRWWR